MKDFDADKYRKANPWVIVNVQSTQTACGRFPTKEAAVEYANANYRGGVIGVEGRTVFVSEIPSL